MERMSYNELIQYCNDHGYDHYTEIPDGWVCQEGAYCAPLGSEYIHNGKLPGKGRKSGLLIMVQKDDQTEEKE